MGLQTTNNWEVLAVCPDVAKLLAAMALHKAILCSICLYPDYDVAEVWQFENFSGFCRPWQGYQDMEGLWFLIPQEVTDRWLLSA
jgi:hypothetical protein